MLNGLCIFFWGEGCYFSCSSGDKKLENQGVAAVWGGSWFMHKIWIKSLKKSKLKPERTGNLHVVGVSSHLRQLSLWGKSTVTALSKWRKLCDCYDVIPNKISRFTDFRGCSMLFKSASNQNLSNFFLFLFASDPKKSRVSDRPEPL